MAENRWNLPNALAAYRLIGSFVLAGVALAEASAAFPWLLLSLLASDWIDGKLAIWWNQRTVFGARLDSLADATMYGSLLFGTIWLKGQFVGREWPWIAAALGTYAVTTGAGLIKYRRIPSYHTRAAKTSWLLVGVAAVNVFAEGPAWPFRLAMVVVCGTNLEATAMTVVLPIWHADVPSLWHAYRLRDVRSPMSDDGMDHKGERVQQNQGCDHVPGK